MRVLYALMVLACACSTSGGGSSSSSSSSGTVLSSSSAGTSSTAQTGSTSTATSSTSSTIRSSSTAATSMASSHMGASSSGQPQGLEAAYGFTQGSGVTLSDATGHNHTGTLVGGPTWSTGQHGGGLTFSGNGDHVTMGDVNALDGLTRLTVSAWIKTTATGERHIVDKSACDGAARGGPFELGTGFFTAGKVSFLVYREQGTPAFLSAESTASVVDGAWHHIAAVYDGSSLQLFVDGAASGSTAATGFTLASSTNALELGGHCNGHAYPWSGGVDDVRIYTRALSALEIQADMSSAVVDGVAPVMDAGVPDANVASDGGVTRDASVSSDAGYFIDFTTAAIENPLSAGGVWTNNTQGTGGNVAPGNMTSMRVDLASDGVTRIAFETHEGFAYDDSFAFVPGFVGNQFAEAVIYKEPGYNANAAGFNHELELILGCSSASGSRIWNEFLFNSGGGLDILYLNGGPSDFTSIANVGFGTGVIPEDGDVVRAERVGNVLSFYINGVLQVQYDGTNPGYVATGSGIGIAGFIRPGATHGKYGFRRVSMGTLP